MDQGKHVIKELKAKVREVPVENSKLILWYYNVANQIYLQMQTYMRDNDLEYAYMLNLKLASLLVSTVPKHNSYHLKKYQHEKNKYKKMASTAMDNVELLSSAILLSYQYNDHKINKRIQQTTSSSSSSSSSSSRAEAKIKPKPKAKAKSKASKPQAPRPAPSPSSSSLRVSALPAPDDGLDVLDAFSYPKTVPSYASNSTPSSASSSSVAAAPASSTSSGSSVLSGRLRPLHIGQDLTQLFMQYAHSNTVKNTETCALMLGKLLSDAFYITHLVFPRQSGNANSTTTSHEEELIELQMEHELITLGWIHTHPSQSCFLSSIDLHTQFSYQCMLPEAIAIVVAPTDQKLPCGVFTLTETGQKVLEKCRLSGFHEHKGVDPSTPMFTNATHVVVNPSTQQSTTVIDLRVSP
jgi:STAM-binding protein